MPVPLDLDFSRTKDYAPGKKTKTYHDDSPEVKRLAKAYTLGKSVSKHILFIHVEIQVANKQIIAMDAIVRDHKTKESKEILKEHFGEHYDIKAIEKSVTLLKNGKVGVEAVNNTKIPEHVNAYSVTYKGLPQKIGFGPSFYSPDRTTQDTAGTILHEASHALLQTGDRYKRVGKGKDAHLVMITRDEFEKLNMDKEQHENLVEGCKFLHLLDTISR